MSVHGRDAVRGNGTYRVAYRAVDRAGHVETTREVLFVVAVPTNVEAPGRRDRAGDARADARAPAQFGAFTPGVARDYTASTTGDGGLDRR